MGINYWRLGFRFGMAQGHALLAPLGAAFLFGLGAWLGAVLFSAAGALGWFIWARDYDLAWRVEQVLGRDS